MSLVVTYNPSINNLSTKKKINIFYPDEEVKKVFPLRLLVAYKIACKIKEILVKLKICHLERTGGSLTSGAKDVRIFLMLQKQTYLNPSKLRSNARLINTFILMTKVWFTALRLVGHNCRFCYWYISINYQTNKNILTKKSRTKWKTCYLTNCIYILSKRFKFCKFLAFF